MEAARPSPWGFLLSRLRVGTPATFTREELAAAGLDAATLLSARLIERVPTWKLNVPGCERQCDEPVYDFETKALEGLVGVGCPVDTACWRGVKWLPASSLEAFACAWDGIGAVLGQLNGLYPVEAGQRIPGVSVSGVYRRRGLSMVVALVPSPSAGLMERGRSLKQRFGTDGAVLLAPRAAVGALPVTEDRIVLLDLKARSDGALEAWRALDLLDPGYRSRRCTDSGAIFDDVTLELSTEPGVRHLVLLNGVEVRGFGKSDLKFLRLLLLAQARTQDADVDDGGWIEKHELEGPNRDRDIEELRGALRDGDHPVLSRDERKSLIKSSHARDGRVRLALDPRNIRLDPSLAQLIPTANLVGAAKKGRKTEGNAKHLADMELARKTAEQLFNRFRKKLISTDAARIRVSG